MSVIRVYDVPLNSNIRCIEIKELLKIFSSSGKLNSNIRCIEIRQQT